MKNPRVLIAGLFHETHTFLPGETTLGDCEVVVGEAMLRVRGDASPLGGVLEAAQSMDWEVVPALDVRAMPGPICDDEIVQFWWRHVEEALKTRPHGVFLVLHGAMVSRGLEDVEGDILRRIRADVAPTSPIGGVTDLHANFSLQMAQNSDCLVTYRENPHIDARERGVQAALLLDFLLHNDERARTFFRAPPLMWPPTGTGTADAPMRDLERLARRIERDDPQILAANVHAGYSFADVRDVGVSFSIVSVGEENRAQKALDELENLALKNRETGNVIEPSFESLLPKLRALLLGPGDGPIVVAEPSDNIGGGAPGDGTGLLREFLKHQIGRSVVVLNDGTAVQRVENWELGARQRLQIGGASGFAGAGPLDLELELLGRSDGRFELEDAQSHLASLFGLQVDMGPCATLRHILPGGAELWVLLTTRKTPPFDLGQLRSQGIEPERMAVIGVKAAVAHRRAYEPMARALFAVATPGPCASDLKTLPFRRVRRPIFPLDELND